MWHLLLALHERTEVWVKNLQVSYSLVKESKTLNWKGNFSKLDRNDLYNLSDRMRSIKLQAFLWLINYSLKSTVFNSNIIIWH